MTKHDKGQKLEQTQKFGTDSGVSIFSNFFLFFSKTRFLGFEFFIGMQIKFFFKSVSFFFLKALFVTKTFIFQENLHFNKLKRVFPAFCTIFGN